MTRLWLSLRCGGGKSNHAATCYRIKYETAPDGTEWLVLNLAHDYAIEAGRIDSEIKLLWWVDHLCGKPWMTIETMGIFIGRVVERNGFQRGEP